METRLGGPKRDPQHLGRLGQRQVEVVPKDDEGALIRRQPAQRAVEEVPVRERGKVVLDPRMADSGVSSTSVTRRRWRAGRVEAGVDGQTMEPGIEPLRLAQPGQIAPGADEASWTASRASSVSRRMRRAIASSRATASRTSTAKAS